MSPFSQVRLSTDLLMVNPNKGFKWHQDNQNGPVAFEHAMRFWVTLDDTPVDHGAPVYLRGSHRNRCVSESAVFVDISTGELATYAADTIEFRPRAGDMLVWHPRSIHKIDGPKSQDWGARLRRVLGGTAILGNAPYVGEGKALFGDLGRHSLRNGDPLRGALFPRLYPSSLACEREARERGECTRTVEVRGSGQALGRHGGARQAAARRSLRRVFPLPILHARTGAGPADEQYGRVARPDGLLHQRRQARQGGAAAG